MAIKLGSTTIGSLRLGSTEITKAYLGSTEIYSTGGILDFSSPTVAYSLMDLGDNRAAFDSIGDTGGETSGVWVVQVRRDIDDDLKSFTASEVSNGAMLTWVGTGSSSNGYVSRWYDQSTSQNDAVMATSADQPYIVQSGVLLQDSNGKPKISFASSDYMSFSEVSASTPSVFAVWENPSNQNRGVLCTGFSGWQVFFSDGSTDSDMFYDINFSFVDPDIYVDGSSTSWSTEDDAHTSMATGNQMLLSLHHNSNAGQIKVSSLCRISTLGTTSSQPTDLSEFIIYNLNQSSSRTTIESNINSRYSIY